LLTDPLGGSNPLAGAAIASVNATLIDANARLAPPGSWKAVATNPGGKATSPFLFDVVGTPTVSGNNLTQADHANLKLTLQGVGFMSGLTVSITPQAGGGAIAANVVSVAATRVDLSATLPNAGNYQAVVTNPGGYAAPASGFTAT